MKINKIKLIFILLVVIIILIIGEISRKSFLNYENTIVAQQEEQLLTISKLVGKSLENFVEEKIKGINNLSENISSELSEDGDYSKILKRLEAFSNSQQNGISNLYFMDFNTNEQLSYPLNIKGRFFFQDREEFLTNIKTLKKQGLAYIGKTYKDAENSYVFNIFKPVYSTGTLRGVIVGRIKVNDMYNTLVKPVKAGEFGYAMVKNSDGIIIMHPVKEQIGYDVLEGRKEKYPDLDYDELENLVNEQLSGREGTYIYHSYWWTQKNLVKVKKFQAFSSVNITDKFWIVAVTMSYDEIREPIKRYLYNVISIAVILIFTLSTALFLIMKMINSKEAYKIEMSYLKELNESSEILRKKEAELHHKRKLETIGTLTGGIAHEFNNILTPIMGYSEMILDRINPQDDIYEDIEVIHSSSKRARDVIDQILIFSRDKNNMIQYEVIDINKVVSEAVKFFESTMPSNIEITKNLNTNVGNVFANETQIHQVILNLCINAYNAMKNTDGNLDISLESVHYDQDERLKSSDLERRQYIKLSVKDTGCGMDSDTMAKIFDPFFTKKLSDDSTGLGLSVVMGIITKHGGKIFVDSTLGKGSQFDIYLPQSDRKRAVETSEKEISLKGTERVLIIDDQKVIADMLEKSLNNLGYKTSSYTDGSRVLKEFNNIKDKFDIVVSDIAMPEISGIQLAKKFRKNKPDIKIILMTANTDEPLEEYIQDKLIDDYLLKPVSAEKISKRIRKVLDK